MKIPSSIWTLLIGIVLTLVSLWYGQNHGLLPIPASDEAYAVDGVFNAMMIVSCGIFLLVEGIIIYCAFRYRQRPGDNADGPPIHGNIPLEILWTAIPAVIVIGISIYSFEVYEEIGGINPHGGHDAPIISNVVSNVKTLSGSAIAATLKDTPMNGDSSHMHHHMQMSENVAENQPDATVAQSFIDETTTADVVVDVAGLQYAWIFTYPDTGIVSGELHIPIGKVVQVNMKANDVIHAFWVPEFRLKQDAIPGREVQFRFTPNRAGTYPLICAELCGPYHGAMRTQVIVHTEQDYSKWQQENQIASTQQLESAIALAPEKSSPAQLLSHYSQSMGVNGEVLKQLHNSSF
ncbi:MAG: cytochrome c oxidase subunit II [Cyanobacteria bacterium P01_A01_bin.45]